MNRHLLRALALFAWFAVAAVVARSGEVEYPHGDFEADCTTCHDTEAWRPTRPDLEFDHDESGFALRGAHAQTGCTSCHSSLRFRETSQTCVSCHLDVHRSELGIDCARCHNTRSFIDRSVMQRRHVETRLPLRGTHLSADCGDCHPPAPQGGLQYVNTPVECEACHLDAYLNTSDPDHQTAGFSTDCAACHPPTAWSQGRFNHATVTGSCQSCHLDDYLGTTDPDHQAEGYPTECELCHRPTDWEDAQFNHATVTGSCQSCHLDDYLATTSPDHQAAGFPTTCELCHNTNDWSGATALDHDGLYFPIYTGSHRNHWSDCSDCHISPGDFSAFTCLSCHPHSDESKTNGDHDEVSGYMYDSQACYACHPQGEH
jgi:hypothetical protein